MRLHCLLGKLILDLVSFMYVNVLPACAPLACLVPEEARVGYLIPWNRSYRQLRPVMWVLGIKPDSSRGQPMLSTATISAAPHFTSLPTLSVQWGDSCYSASISHHLQNLVHLKNTILWGWTTPSQSPAPGSHPLVSKEPLRLLAEV